MTNAEKFKEIFGYTIDTMFPDGPCTIIDHAICVNHEENCETCELHNFWDKEYTEGNQIKFTEENFWRILTNFKIVVNHRFYPSKDEYIVIPRKEADEMHKCSEEFIDIACMLHDKFADQFHHNPRARKICPNENCKTVYAYFYEEFEYCPKCGTKLTTGVKKHD